MPTVPGSGVTQTSLVILCPLVLLVEGKDEINFFAALLCYMSPEATVEVIETYSNRSLQCIVKNVSPGVDIELREVGGKDQFPKRLSLFLVDPGFPQLKAYAIIRDADSNAEHTLKSVQDLLIHNRQPCPTEHACFALSDDNTLKVGIFVMPGLPALTGMLEDLCLLSVKDHTIMPHVTHFGERVKEMMGKKAPKNPSKATVQTFLSGMHDHMTSLGIAAQKQCWPFDNVAFSNLRSFLERFTQ